MKSTVLLSFALLVITCTTKLMAGGVYAEYLMTGPRDTKHTSKLFAKDGDIRSEVKMEVAGIEMNTVVLRLKSNPGVSFVLNSMTKTYTETKPSGSTDKKEDITITIIGNEKIGSYNCKHVRMTSNSKSWDMWVTKDLSSFGNPYENDEATNHKVMELLKSNDADGLMVKLAFFKPGTTTATMTMELTKYEPKELDASLFKIPTDYTKGASWDPEQIKNMTPEQRQEMIKKMMEQNTRH